MQSKIPLTVAIIAVAVGVAALAYFRLFAGPDPEVVIESIHAALQEVRATESEDQIDLGAASGIEWDEVFVFGPYTTAQRINTALGSDYNEAQLSGIDQRDDIALLAFTKSARVIALVPYPRAKGDFAASSRQDSILRGNALFELIPLVSDANWINLSLAARPQVSSP